MDDGIRRIIAIEDETPIVHQRPWRRIATKGPLGWPESLNSLAAGFTQLTMRQCLAAKRLFC